MSADLTRNGSGARCWRLRYQIARALIHAGLRVMPPSRYRRELNAALWTLGLRVQATVAAHQHAEMDTPDSSGYPDTDL